MLSAASESSSSWHCNLVSKFHINDWLPLKWQNLTCPNVTVINGTVDCVLGLGMSPQEYNLLYAIFAWTWGHTHTHILTVASNYEARNVCPSACPYYIIYWIAFEHVIHTQHTTWNSFFIVPYNNKWNIFFFCQSWWFWADEKMRMIKIMNILFIRLLARLWSHPGVRWWKKTRVNQWACANRLLNCPWGWQ